MAFKRSISRPQREHSTSASQRDPSCRGVPKIVREDIGTQTQGILRVPKCGTSVARVAGEHRCGVGQLAQLAPCQLFGQWHLAEVFSEDAGTEADESPTPLFRDEQTRRARQTLELRYLAGRGPFFQRQTPI